MKKTLSLTLMATVLSLAAYALGPISGSTGACLGSNGHVTDSLNPGGTWSSSNTMVATIDATGTVYGIIVGSTTITYSLGGSIVTAPYTVYSAPPPSITGSSTFCAGTSGQLANAAPGGTWSSSSNYVATVDPTTGMVYGVHAGYAYIYYTTNGQCSASVADTIIDLNPGVVSVPLTVCAGSTISVDDSSTSGMWSTGGTWSSSNTAVATVGSTSAYMGLITGISVGSATITFTISNTCGTAYATNTVNVVNTNNAGAISGASSVTAGSSYYLNETVSGGTWSSASPAIATIDPISGQVFGVSAGTTDISYTVSGCGPAVSVSTTITVNAFNGISGHVNFPGSSYYGYVKVWLITYNSATSDLEAVDSVYQYCNGTSMVYQFPAAVTDSYRVKAATDSTFSAAGYIPTYHTSSFYWFSANVIAHVAGTADVNEDINMMSGTATSGPGFIGGNVAAGANRGTQTGVPVIGMNIYLVNSSTNQPMQSVRTDVNGDYSFSNLPVGTYYVFPDSLNYMTTAFTGINITASATSVTAADFGQHTLSKTIKPSTTAVSNIGSTMASVIAFPNPTNGKLNLQWNENTTENAQVTISDITGRQVYQAAMKMNAGSGVKQIDLSALVNGLYIISVKSADISYISKVQVQK